MFRSIIATINRHRIHHNPKQNQTMIPRILTVISLLLLGAHALRTGDINDACFWLLGIGLAVSPWPWTYSALAGLLGFGTFLWVGITVELAQQRLALGLPWLRLAIILGSVTLICFVAGGWNLRRAMQLKSADNLAPGGAFLLTVGGLSLARQMSSLDILLVDRFLPGGGWVAIFLLGVYAALITTVMLDTAQSARWRRIIWTAFSVVFFAQLLLGLAGLEKFLMTGALHLPVPALIAAGPIFRGEGLFMIILFGAAVILVGPAWCSYLCYIGSWDNLAATANRRATPLPSWTRAMRWLICIAVLGLALILGRIGMAAPPAAVLAAGFGLVGVGLMVLWSRRTGTMTHCLTYCPMGLLADLFGRINPWRIKIHDGCNQCGRCSRVCRYNALTPADLAGRRAGFTCSLCGDCISACPDNHLHYTFPGLGDTAARAVFLAVAVSLHALFLGVARL
ncbi:4Fe-4S binding protein [Desulfofustis glycolicus]|nr:4Fe-4S binding protein [Desulfofustis glycolicus]MCB2216257.1 4Fe-4S binding protein [Desulfobulbaceae bacterium]